MSQMSQPSHSSSTAELPENHDSEVASIDEDGDGDGDDDEDEDDDAACTEFIDVFQSMNVVAAGDALKGQPPRQSDCCSPCTLRYVDGFPLWESFPLLFVSVGGKQNTVLIHPVFNGRFAVPVIPATGQD